MIIRKWIYQNNFEGTDYSDYYVGAHRLFRANPNDRHNFEYIREHLHATSIQDIQPTYPAEVLDVAFEDECLIARYMVLVHKDFAKGVRMAEMFAQRLATKGYVDPEASISDEEDNEAWASTQLPVNAPSSTGRYKVIKVETGHQGYSTTTYSVTRKSDAREREAAKKAQLVADIGQITGKPVELIARPLDGIVRRWTAVRRYEEDDTRDPVEK
jgi:hypothetical protein